jgi:hypothetical protein
MIFETFGNLIFNYTMHVKHTTVSRHVFWYNENKRMEFVSLFL